MNIRDAAKVKKGDTLHCPAYDKSGKVEEVLPEPTEAEPRGIFPLFKMDFDDQPITFKLFKLSK